MVRPLQVLCLSATSDPQEHIMFSTYMLSGEARATGIGLPSLPPLGGVEAQPGDMLSGASRRLRAHPYRG